MNPPHNIYNTSQRLSHLGHLLVKPRAEGVFLIFIYLDHAGFQEL